MGSDPEVKEVVGVRNHKLTTVQILDLGDRLQLHLSSYDSCVMTTQEARHLAQAIMHQVRRVEARLP